MRSHSTANHRKRILLTLSAVVAALALAACGGGGSSASTQSAGEGAATTSAGSDAVLVSAASKATNAGSSKVDFVITTQIPGKDGPVTLKGNGAFDYKAQQGKLTYDFSELFAATGQSALGNEPVQVILDKTTFYMKFALLSQLLPDAKPWIEFNLEKLGKLQGVDLGQLAQLNQGDPSGTLAYLTATGEVTKVGTEQVNGVSTTHYHAVVDLDKVVQQAPAADQAALQQSVDKLKEQLGTSTLPIDVWIGDDGLPARIKYDVKVSVSGQESASVLQMDFTDWGVPVTVTPPPADQVTDITSLAALAGAGSTSG